MKNQRGFADIILIIVAVILAAGLGGYVYYQQLQNQKAYQAAGNGVTISSHPKKTGSTTATTQSDPAPASTATPAAIPKTTVSVSGATALTSANCKTDNAFTVYVSNKAGAEGSYQPPGSWQAVKTFTYGEAITVTCSPASSFSPDYVVTSTDMYIKSSNLSPTKP